jgi:hypothetical protein
MMNGVEVYNVHAKVGVFVKRIVVYANGLHLIALSPGCKREL